jgi:predicted DsbA family dithiol-disulfide isomerase
MGAFVPAHISPKALVTAGATESTEGRWLLRLAVGCALAMTALVAAKLLGLLDPSGAPDVEPVNVAEHWPALLEGGHRTGPADASVVIVEFADFECPFCRGYAVETLPTIKAEYPDHVAVIYRHYPLEYHRFAFPSALAADCAGRQGQFSAMHDLLYEKQDSIGLLAWDEVARRSGVSDVAAWEACRADPAVREAVEADRELAKQIGATGTPTVVVNGIRYPDPPDAAALRRIIEAAGGR